MINIGLVHYYITVNMEIFCAYGFYIPVHRIFIDFCYTNFKTVHLPNNTLFTQLLYTNTHTDTVVKQPEMHTSA